MSSPFRRAILSAIGFVTATACLHAQPIVSPNRVCFVDEAGRDPSLVKYREELRAAVITRDVKRVRPLLAPDVSLGHFGVRSIALRDLLVDPGSPYWEALGAALSLGGVFQSKGVFCAPFFSCPSPPEWDGASVLILGSEVPAHAQPSAESPVIARLACDVVKAMTGEDGLPPATKETARWTGIWTPSGQRAFVRNAQVAYPDTYLHLEKRNGRWLLVAIGGVD